MSRRQKTRQARAHRNDRCASLTVMTALEALCLGKGLLESEREAAREAGLERRRWTELGEALAAGETLHPRGPEIRAAVVWACGGEVAGGVNAPVRSLLRTRRREAMGPSLQAGWPRKGKEGARAWCTVSDWHGRPHALGASDRTLLREIWRGRAAMCHFDQDLDTLEVMMRSPTQIQALADLCAEGVEPGQMGERLGAEPLDRASAEAVLHAAEESLRGGEDDSGWVASLWLKARALEAMGLRKRAIRAYHRVETAERERGDTKPSEVPGPRRGDARKRKVWLMWSSGEPETMREALEMGVEEGGGAWLESRAREWNAAEGEAQLKQVQEAYAQRTRAQAAGTREARDDARLALAKAYRGCGLNDLAVSTAWERATEAETEAELAAVAARSAADADKAEHTVKMLWDRVLEARPHDAEAMLGLATREAELGNRRNAALWATRALWTNRRTRTLDAAHMSEAAEILREDGRHEAAARADRRIMRENMGRILGVNTAIGMAERAIERADAQWEESMDRALDAIAVNRAGLATLCVLSAQTLRERAQRRCTGTPARAQAEAVRRCVRAVTATPKGRERPQADPHRRYVRRALARESRRRKRVLARLPEPLAMAVRAAQAVDLMDDPQGALRAGADDRTAAMWEEWALRLKPSGHPTDARAQREIERVRRARKGKREEGWEWEGIEHRS